MSEFDYTTVSPWLLGEIKLAVANGGRVAPSRGMAAMMKRGLVVPHMYHGDLKPIGFALARGLCAGARFKISQTYHIPQMRGRTGTITDVRNAQIDDDGVREVAPGFIVPEPRIKWGVCISTRVDDDTATWCFWKPEDLDAQ